MIRTVIVSLLLISATTSARASSIGLGCEDVFALAGQSDFSQSTLSKNITAFRKKQIRSANKLKEVVVNNRRYQIIGLLGVSRSKAYLGRAPDGELVSIKTIKPDGDDPLLPNSVYYEEAATNFYLEHGEIMPRVIDYEVVKNKSGQIRSATLIKEYREGLTIDDLRAQAWMWQPFKDDLDKSFGEERLRFKALHREFRGWLKERNIDLEKHPFAMLEELISDGDNTVFSNNMLFDIKAHRWIIFDP